MATNVKTYIMKRLHNFNFYNFSLISSGLAQQSSLKGHLWPFIWGKKMHDTLCAVSGFVKLSLGLLVG